MRIIQGIRNRIIARTGKIYRIYMYTLGHYKLKKYITTRKGKCKKCGACCSGCNFLDKKTNLCKDFEIAKQMGCVLFPISPFDQKRVGVEKICGFYWDKTK